MNLQQLIKEAQTFGSAACAEGRHLWESEGGRSCPKESEELCGQVVYRCSSCGEYDYGYKGGPAWNDCISNGCHL